MGIVPNILRIVGDFTENLLFFRHPRRSVTRRAWCSFFAVGVVLCATAYLAMSGAAALLQACFETESLREFLGSDGYYLMMDGGPTGFTIVGLLLLIPFLTVSIRRMRDAGLSPWWLMLPPALLAAATVLLLLYMSCYNPGFMHSGDISYGGGAWLAVCAFATAALSYLSTLALLFLMAFRKSR